MTETKTKELIVIKPAQLAEVFVENGLDPYIEIIKAHVGDIVPDLSTKKGRDAIKSRAYWVAQKKTLIDKAGKEYAADLKSKIKPIDAERKRMRDILEALQADIKKSLLEWQAEEDRIKKVEEDRVEAIRGNINGIKNYLPLAEGGSFCQLHSATSKQIQTAINRLSELPVGDHFAEFKEEAETAHKAKLDELAEALTFALEKEKLAADKKLLDDKEKERKARAREKEVADKAREDERLKNEKKAQKECDDLSRDKIRADLKTKRLVQEKIDTAERVEQEKKKAKEKAEKDQEEAVEAERLKLKGIEDVRIEADKERAANNKHRLKINTEVLSALKKIITDEKVAEEVLVSLSMGKIPNVTINY